MDDLRRRVGDIASLIPPSSQVVYLDYPVHLNIGDLLINLGTEHFLRQQAIRVSQRASIFNFCFSLGNRITKDAVILLHGGGNFGDLWIEHQSLRETIISRFRDNRILMLPQTLYFKDSDLKKRSLGILASHPDLHVFVRDGSSFDELSDHMTERVYLAPDMAHALWGEIHPSCTSTENSAMFLRRDIEASTVPQSFAADTKKSVDWEDVLKPADVILFRALRKLHVVDRKLGHRLPMEHLWYPCRDRLIARGKHALSSAKQIITNRLHVCILGLLLGRNVIAFDNSYGKLSSYYDAWLSGLPGLRFSRPGRSDA